MRVTTHSLVVLFRSALMEATIPGKSLLMFGKMLQSLAKVGDDLFFDAVDDQVR